MAGSGRMVIGVGRHTADFTFSGGAWDSRFPVTNLGTMPVGRPGRTLDVDTASTRIVAVSTIPKSVGLIGFVEPVINPECRFAIRFYADEAGTSLLRDDGWQDMCPIIYPCGTVPFFHESWLTGRYTRQQLEGRSWVRPLWLGERLLVKRIEVDFSDTGNYAAEGRRYTSPPTVTLSGGGGSGAAVSAVLDSQGHVVSYTVNAPGTGYSSVPTVAVTGGGGVGAVAKASVSGGQITGVAPARYFQLGLMEIAEGWQVSYNPQRGAAYGFEFRTKVGQSDGGTRNARRRAKPSRLKGSIPYLPHDEAMVRGRGFLEDHDLDVPFLVVPRPDNPTHWPRECFLGFNNDPGFAARVTGTRDSFPFDFTQAL